VIVAATLAGFAAGLAAVPHCVGMCGPLVAFAQGDSPHSGAAIRYHLGRLVGYGLLGVAAGSTGHALAALWDPRWSAALTSWTLAVALAYTAWRLSRPQRHARPALTPLRREPRAPSLAQRVLERIPRSPGALGLATALLPCGALATGVLVAAGSGAPLSGAAAMVAFGVASGGGLVIVSALSAQLARRATSRGLRLGLAAVLVVGAVVMAVRPLSTLRGDPAECHVPPAEAS
jgi:sulfite exporter TauE/SafE